MKSMDEQGTTQRPQPSPTGASPSTSGSASSVAKKHEARLRALGVKFDSKYEATYECADCQDTGYSWRIKQGMMFTAPCTYCMRGVKVGGRKLPPTGDKVEDEKRGWRSFGD